MMLGINNKCAIARPLLLFQEERQTVSCFLKDVRMPCRTYVLLVKVQSWEFSSFTHVAGGRCKG